MDYPFVLWMGNTRGRPGLLPEKGLGDLVTITTVAGGTMMCFDGVWEAQTGLQLK
jgi:hypothetical protein